MFSQPFFFPKKTRLKKRTKVHLPQQRVAPHTAAAGPLGRVGAVVVGELVMMVSLAPSVAVVVVKPLDSVCVHPLVVVLS